MKISVISAQQVLSSDLGKSCVDQALVAKVHFLKYGYQKRAIFENNKE